MEIMAIVGAVVLAVLGGLAIYKLVKLTVEVIKNLRQKKHTKEAIMKMKGIIQEAAKNPDVKHIKFNDLNQESVVCAEIDKKGEIIGKPQLFDKVDDRVENLLDDEPLVILED